MPERSAAVWEYDVRDWKKESDFRDAPGTPGLIAMLNEEGRQGWELVAVEHISASTSSFIFMRSKDR